MYEAAVKACEATDTAIGRIYEACKANGTSTFPRYELVASNESHFTCRLCSDGDGRSRKRRKDAGSRWQQAHCSHLQPRSIHLQQQRLQVQEGGYFVDFGGLPLRSISSRCESLSLQLTDRAPALCDVAPTVLEVMGLPKPPEMTGVSLVEKV